MKKSVAEEPDDSTIYTKIEVQQCLKSLIKYMYSR